MLSTSMQQALCEQINNEFYASHLYLSMSAYFANRGLDGFAHWMRLQSDEERTHALRLFDIVSDRGGHVILGGVPQPATEFESPLEVIRQALEHEQKVTSDFQELYNLSVREGDYTTQAQLQWFITEQVEEEKNASTLLNQLELIGGQGTALFLLDRELAARSPSAT